MELHTQVAYSSVHAENKAMVSMAYDLHKLHPLKGAVSLGAHSPMGVSLKDSLKGGRRCMEGPDTSTEIPHSRERPPMTEAYLPDTQRQRRR